MTKAELVAFLKEARLTATDNAALQGMELYDEWKAGVYVTKGKRLRYGSKLYRVKQTHTTQTDWTPDKAAAMFEVVNATHAGTLEDPIPWAMNMKCYKGKYYTWDNALYLCTNDSGIALAYTPDQLIGHFFEVV